MSATTRTSKLFARLILVPAALLLLWAAVASDRSPAVLSAAAIASEAELNEKALLAESGPLEAEPDAAEGGQSERELAPLRIFNRVVVLIKDNYLDPKRIEPRKMLIGALDSVERQVAEVMVEGDESSPKINVTVNKVSKEFDVSGVTSFWQMSFALRDIFAFIAKNLERTEDVREIEYAAANGMLSTLDPHSVLLKPDYNKEMRVQTKGEFGGLGFVVQMREGNLTVVKVLKGTPAQKASVKSKDIIQRINNESTTNMDLTEAVDRLRGKPGTEVTLRVAREGWAAPKQLTLTRAIINVESVESKLLSNDVGYLRIKGFQGNTTRDLYHDLGKLKLQAQAEGGAGLKGLVLDLRGNPGGLLEQAVQVSDAFLSDGTIVATVGKADTVREEKRARADESDIKLPLVVLVSSSSASASEIVAGALKNNNRAIVVGRPTFGKGSVQVLFDFPDESALKLTIAQYLTPGDISIQEVGITPDIELIPARINKEKVDLFAPKRSVGEADLDKHLANPSSGTLAKKRDEVVRTEKPSDELRFLRDEPKPKTSKLARGAERPDRDDYEYEDYEGVDPDTDEIVEDYPIRFARDLLLAAPYTKRDQQLAASRGFMAERKSAEAERIRQSLEGIGIGWAAPAPLTSEAAAAVPKLAIQMSPTPDEKSKAGETLSWTLSVKNTGAAPLARLRAYSESENPFLDRREFVFGTLAPGEERAWTVKVKLPKDLLSRRDAVTLKFTGEGDGGVGPKLDDFKSEINIVALPRPRFAWSWQIVDKCDVCNGDGQAQAGETVELQLEVKNLGSGMAHDAVAMLKNKGDETLSLKKGRVKLGALQPGATKSGLFEFELSPELASLTAPLQLIIGDDPTDEYVTERLELPIALPRPKAIPVAAKSAQAMRDLTLRASALPDSAGVAHATKGELFDVEAQVGDFYRVRYGELLGFAPAADLALRPTSIPPKKRPKAISTATLTEEPHITLDLDAAAGGLVTDAEAFTLSGEASAQGSLRDLYIFVNEQKAYFKAAADGEKALRFSASLPLKSGVNVVVVVARRDKELTARKVLYINRRGGELAQESAGHEQALPAASPKRAQ